MSCERFQRAFVDHLDDGAPLPPEFDEHAASCASCRGQWSQLEELDALLRSMPVVVPPDGFAERVRGRLLEDRVTVRALAGRTVGRRISAWWSLAAAAAGLALGLSLASRGGTDPASRMAELTTENDRLRAVVEGLVDTGATPGVRLAAVTAIESRSDTLDLGALIGALRTDPAVGVRLAAAAALEPHAAQREVARAVAAALAEEPSPHVQLALLRVAARTGDDAEQSIRRLLDRDDLDAPVRAEAERRLRHRTEGIAS